MKPILFFCPLFLFATVNEPLRWEIFSGYRNDRIHWHLQQPGEGGALTYSELSRDLQFWENGFALKVIHRDLAFAVRGGYAAFGKGELFQRYADLSFTSDNPHFQFDSHGWAADGSGLMGYAVNLTADRTYKVILIPLFGFSAHFERCKRTHGTPDPFGGENFSMRSQLPRLLRQTWYGFFLGGNFTIEPGGSLVLHAGYTYHWLHSRLKASFRNEVSPIEQTTSVRVKANEGGNLGHTGWAELEFFASSLCRLGLGAQIHYFVTRIFDAKLQQNINGEESDLLQKFKLRWTSVSGWVQISKEF